MKRHLEILLIDLITQPWDNRNVMLASCCFRKHFIETIPGTAQIDLEVALEPGSSSSHLRSNRGPAYPGTQWEKCPLVPLEESLSPNAGPEVALWFGSSFSQPWSSSSPDYPGTWGETSISVPPKAEPNAGSPTPTKETNKVPVAKLQKIETHKIPDKEFEISSKRIQKCHLKILISS